MTNEFFSKIYNGPFTNYLLASKSLGDDIYEHSKLIDHTFQMITGLLDMLNKYAAPPLYQKLDIIIEPIAKQISTVQDYVKEREQSTHFFHIAIVSESIKLLEWVIQENPKIPIDELIVSMKNYKQIILEKFGKNGNHETWLVNWQKTIEDLAIFMKTFYPDGLCWKGVNKFPSAVLLGDIPNCNRTFDHSDLFQEINQGESILGVLRQMHNRTDDCIENIANTTYGTNCEIQVFMLDDKKWRIENKNGDHKNLIISAEDSDNDVYIYNCCDCTIVVDNKVNTIRLDSCQKVAVLFKSVLTGIEIFKSEVINIHGFGAIPNAYIDSSSNVKLYLTDESLGVLISTRKSEKVVVIYPFSNGSARSFCVPEQLITTVDIDKGLITNVVNNKE